MASPKAAGADALFSPPAVEDTPQQDSDVYTNVAEAARASFRTSGIKPHELYAIEDALARAAMEDADFDDQTPRPRVRKRMSATTGVEQLPESPSLRPSSSLPDMANIAGLPAMPALRRYSSELTVSGGAPSTASTNHPTPQGGSGGGRRPGWFDGREADGGQQVPSGRRRRSSLASVFGLASPVSRGDSPRRKSWNGGDASRKIVHRSRYGKSVVSSTPRPTTPSKGKSLGGGKSPIGSPERGDGGPSSRRRLRQSRSFNTSGSPFSR